MAKEFIKVIGLDCEVDKERLFEFTSINIKFLRLLDKNDKEVYLMSECSEISDIFCNDDCVNFKTAFGTIEIDPNVSYRIKICDDNNHSTYVSEVNDAVRNQIYETIEETWPQFSGMTFNEIKEKLEKEKNIDDVER